LVGTASIETSEYLSNLLKQKGIMHQVLNAKFHEKEAHVVEQAGRPGAITIATNMAGRGTDIVLGGSLEAELAALENPSEEQIAAVKADWQKRHDQVLAAGGLHIIGSERHESRRIDNQLRGRAARQGDPGSTRFFLALDDPLMRIFASPRIASMMRKLGLGETDAIEHKLVTRSIESAQRKVETHHFDVRKQLIEYDDVANDQRRIVYGQRNELLAAEHLDDTVESIREEVLNSVITQHIPEGSLEEQWDIKGLEHTLHNEFGQKFELQKHLDEDQNYHEEELRAEVIKRFEEDLTKKTELAGEENIHLFEKSVMLQVLDAHWKEHLASMDHLRQGIHLRGYAQKDPKQEYKREAFEMFTNFLDTVKYEVLKVIAQVEVREEDVAEIERRRQQSAVYTQGAMNFTHAQMNDFETAAANEQAADMPVEAPEMAKVMPVRREGAKVGRNDPCPCGSGKKYKQCHGRLV
jgi:preprotein translocase subunit SecA